MPMILDESGSKMNKLLKVSWIQGTRIGLKSNFKSIKHIRPGITEGKKVTLGNEKTNQLDSWTYLGRIVGNGIVLPK